MSDNAIQGLVELGGAFASEARILDELSKQLTAFESSPPSEKMLIVCDESGSTHKYVFRTEHGDEEATYAREVPNPKFEEFVFLERLAIEKTALVRSLAKRFADSAVSIAGRVTDWRDALFLRELAGLISHQRPHDFAKDWPVHRERTEKIADWREPEEEPKDVTLPTRATGGGEGSKPEADMKERCRHSEDFTSVVWFGTIYRFSKGNQAECIRVLWAAWEAGTPTLSEATIGDRIRSSADPFRLSNVFSPAGRDTKKREVHPAWNEMIRKAGKGIFELHPPKPSLNNSESPEKRTS